MNGPSCFVVTNIVGLVIGFIGLVMNLVFIVQIIRKLNRGKTETILTTVAISSALFLVVDFVLGHLLHSQYRPEYIACPCFSLVTLASVAVLRICDYWQLLQGRSTKSEILVVTVTSLFVAIGAVFVAYFLVRERNQARLFYACYFILSHCVTGLVVIVSYGIIFVRSKFLNIHDLSPAGSSSIAGQIQSRRDAMIFLITVAMLVFWLPAAYLLYIDFHSIADCVIELCMPIGTIVVPCIYWLLSDAGHVSPAEVQTTNGPALVESLPVDGQTGK